MCVLPLAVRRRGERVASTVFQVNAQGQSNILARFAPPPVLAGAMAMLCWAGSIVVVKDVGRRRPSGLPVFPALCSGDCDPVSDLQDAICTRSCR